MFKQGTTPILLINLGVEIGEVAKIIFTFRQKSDMVSIPMIQKVYPGEIQYEQEIFMIPFTQEETQLFSKVFYVEAQINYTNGNVDKTEITPLKMSDTLFTEVI